MTDGGKLIRIFVGSDRSQLIAFKVLEHSIKRTTAQEVECWQIDNTMMPECKSIENAPYTNFSFARFGIPSFTNYTGRAIYLDADMLVATDIKQLWDIPFAGAKILLLEQPAAELQQKQSKRRKQTAVMMLDCGNLREWVPEKIIGDLGKKYDRTALMSLNIVADNDLREVIPTVWNCMDWYEAGVSNLVHYTRIETQPWVYPLHPCGEIWMDELRVMLKNGVISEGFIREEVKLGYVRPSILVELGFEQADGRELLEIDRAANYKMHEEMTLRHEKRMEFIKKSKKRGLFGFRFGFKAS